MTEGDTLGLAGEAFRSAHVKELVGEVLDSVEGKSTTISVRVHVPFQVLLAVLEDEDELRLGVDDVVEADNVDVLQLCSLVVI